MERMNFFGRKKGTAVTQRRTMLKLLGAGACALPFAFSYSPHAQAQKESDAKNQLRQGGERFWAPVEIDALTAIHTRRSCRDFTGEPVKDEDVQAILAAGMAAPSAKNSQPWSFVVMRTPESLQRITQSKPLTAYALKAGVAILVCADVSPRPGSHLAVVSTAICVQNMLLAAHSLGYGGVYLEIYPDEGQVKAWRSMVNLPEYMVPLTVLAIGKPNSYLPPENRMNLSKIHQETW